MTDGRWKDAGFEGSRRGQQEAFMALPFRDKILEIERMQEVSSFFETQRVVREVPPTAGGPRVEVRPTQKE